MSPPAGAGGESPLVTVVIPTYNRAALVMEAIGSVLRQSYRNFEILVCDDGSTDDTAVRVAQFGPPVRYLALQRSGRPGAPRNRGFEAARGELIAFLDDDDLWEPEKLARQIELMERSPDLNLVYTDRRVQSSNDALLITVHTPTPKRPDQLLNIILNRQMPCVGTLLVRRELLRRVEGFDETLVTGEDLDLFLRIAPIARVAGVPEPLVMVRRQAGSVSGSTGARSFENAIKVLERWRDSGTLPRHVRRRCRGMLAHLHARLAPVLGAQGDMVGALRAVARAIGYAPGRRSSWAAWPRALLARLRRR